MCFRKKFSFLIKGALPAVFDFVCRSVLFICGRRAFSEGARPDYTFKINMSAAPCARDILEPEKQEIPRGQLQFLSQPPYRLFLGKIQSIAKARYAGEGGPFKDPFQERWSHYDQLLFEGLGGQKVFLSALTEGLRAPSAKEFKDKMSGLFRLADKAIEGMVAKNPFLKYGSFAENQAFLERLGGGEAVCSFLETQFNPLAAQAYFESMAAIRETAAMGRGVFALRDIPKNTLFCVGGGNLVLQLNGNIKEDKIFSEISAVANYESGNQNFKLSDYATCLTYQKGVQDILLSFVLFPNVPIGVADLFNAPCTHTHPSEHTDTCRKATNVAFVFMRTHTLMPFLLLYACRDIKAGEQLYRPYGESYWKARLAAKQKAA